MKTLKPKNKPVLDIKPTVATALLERVRKELKINICFLAGHIYREIHDEDPNYEAGEECVIKANELISPPYANVVIGNTYDDETITKRIGFNEFHCLLDDSVIVSDKDGDREWTDAELSVEALAEICDALELTWRRYNNGNL